MITDNAVKDRTTFLAHPFEEKTEKHTDFGKLYPNSRASHQAPTSTVGVCGLMPSGHKPITLPAGPGQPSETQG